MNEEEIAHLRSYLTSQSMRRTPQQLVETLEDTYRAFRQALDAIPDATFQWHPSETAWSAKEVLAHMQTMMAACTAAICAVLERGEQPADQSQEISGAIDPRLRDASRTSLMADLETSFLHLTTAVLQADPQAHLALTWQHFELGPMHWREWLLFVRVHLLVHVRQMQALVQMLAEQNL